MENNKNAIAYLSIKDVTSKVKIVYLTRERDCIILTFLFFCGYLYADSDPMIVIGKLPAYRVLLKGEFYE